VVSWAAIARRIRVPSGFVLAGLYVWLAKPSAISIASGIPFVVAGLLLRGVASGHLQKNEQLATSGPYAYTRNPLYLGSVVMVVGFVIAARSIWIALITLALFVGIYLPVVLGEESHLAKQFPEFSEYARRVPRFVPRLSQSSSPPGAFSWQLYRKHREYNAILGAMAIFAILVAKLHWF
jgi:protein-S-isoprenylcysteine O-methyltransferase Ste14